MSIYLSFCIPTYNRREFLPQTIESIISQAVKNIEIVISDNASTDNTEEIVSYYQKQFPIIKYFRWNKNMGADLNFLKVIEMASGKYCWFMSSDDCLEQGSLSYVLSELSHYPELCGASVNQAIYSSDMIKKIKGIPIAGGQLKTNYLFDRCESSFSVLGLYFGYISGQIVNRNLWQKVVSGENLTPNYNAFVHVYVIGRMLRLNSNWLYIHKKCVGYRSGNDSFLKEEGLYKRQVIAHASFESIVRKLFGTRNPVYSKVLYMALSGYMKSDLVSFKISNISLPVQIKLFLLYSKIYWRYPLFWFKVFPIFLIPNFFIKYVKRIHDWIYKDSNGN